MLALVRPVWQSRVWCKVCYSVRTVSELATLRKQTGYSIKNCKKALEVHNNDLQKATEWLNTEAQKQGWEKATNLQNRVTTQGLIGIQIKDQTAALVEVSCETDFVSKNDIFKDLVKTVASACCVPGTLTSKELYSQEHLGPDQLNTLNWEGKTLKDHVALAISLLGESIVLRRGLLLHAIKDLSLSASVHPNANSGSPMIGTYGALTALKSTHLCQLKHEEMDAMGRELALHIIGLNPKQITQEPGEATKQNPPIQQREEISSSCDESEKGEQIFSEIPETDFLLGQAYVFSPETTVEDVLQEKCVEIVHFVRFERGEAIEPAGA